MAAFSTLRAFNAALFGAFYSGFLISQWILLLDRWLPGSGLGWRTGTKVAANAFIFGLIGNSCNVFVRNFLLSGSTLASGGTERGAKRRKLHTLVLPYKMRTLLKHHENYHSSFQPFSRFTSLVAARLHVAKNVWKVFWADMKLFPPADAICFAFVPPHLRPAFTGVISLCWNTYVSLVANH